MEDFLVAVGILELVAFEFDFASKLPFLAFFVTGARAEGLRAKLLIALGAGMFDLRFIMRCNGTIN